VDAVIFNGHNFHIPPEWPTAAESMQAIWSGEYSYSRERPEDVRTVIDVGANIGGFIVWACEWWPTIERVEAYEPHHEAARICRTNVAHLGRVNVWECAITTALRAHLAPEPGREDNWGGMRTHGVNVGTSVDVMRPMDLPRCDLLKIDCEGCELEVLQHYPYLEDCRIVLVEIHRFAYLAPIRDILSGGGFVMKRDNPQATECDVQAWVRP